ncbi:glycerophosphodiester phosphodiesterase family protein [Flavihumibacter fluvii]|uniref:glycerophosphodiester phosphodiesterase family protein n=1 Tax=Flavihumibacter fluvii TaxID=2838157 RepID=UPI001BDDFFBA|nr:glycerophosphodiester phosphodiesterase family protein [Flavihumibacter fluvii]ULQ52017.1 glycerophosphodiester phosphodiesterase family protein [Flavihumibacter fluvii]
MEIKSLAIVLFQLLWGLAAFGQVSPGLAPKRSFEETRRLFLSPQSGVVLVASHRGTHNDVPENSLASFRKAMEIGVDIIELDIRATKDGILVLMHDGKVDRTTNGTGRVDSLTFAEIRQLRLKHNGKVTDEQVPTFQEALQLTRNRILVDLDIKADDKVNEIIAMVQQEKALNSVIFFVYEPKEVKMIREINKDCLVLARSYKPEDIAPFFTTYKADAIHIDEKQHTRPIVEDILQRGGRVWINALGEVDKAVAAGHPEAFEQVLKYSVNIIQTDYPKLLINYLDKRSKQVGDHQ